MKIDHILIVLGIAAGGVLSLLGGQFPAMRVVPALLWLLTAILMADLALAYIRGVPVITSVSTTTRLIAFCGGALALVLSGALW